MISDPSLYIIQPKPELVQLLANTPTVSPFGVKSLWEMYPEDDDNYRVYLKLRLYFLLEIIQWYRANLETDKALIHQLFGDPPQFDLETVDKWWTIQEPEWLGQHRSSENYISSIVSLIQKTGDPNIDSWLDSFVEEG